jgi:hypothetical protein
MTSLYNNDISKQKNVQKLFFFENVKKISCNIQTVLQEALL